VGLLDESYFLYYEELDFASRLRVPSLWSYSINSLVYHKAGASAGSAHHRMDRSQTAERYATRGRIIICRRHFPWTLPTTLATIVAAIILRLLEGRPSLAKAMIKGLGQGLTAPLIPPPVLPQQLDILDGSFAP